MTELTKPVILVIGGGTASGKTTLARAFVAAHQALHISHDRYYFDVDDPTTHNYDHPDALDTALMVENLAELAAGRPADLPVYDFRTHTRMAQVDRTDPAPLIVVEGILVLHDPDLCALADRRVFVHTAADLRLARRIQRDVVERGRDVAGVLKQYLATVRPMHLTFVEPSRDNADVEISGEQPVEDMLAALERDLRSAGLLSDRT